MRQYRGTRHFSRVFSPRPYRFCAPFQETLALPRWDRAFTAHWQADRILSLPMTTTPPVHRHSPAAAARAGRLGTRRRFGRPPERFGRKVRKNPKKFGRNPERFGGNVRRNRRKFGRNTQARRLSTTGTMREQSLSFRSSNSCIRLLVSPAPLCGGGVSRVFHTFQPPIMLAGCGLSMRWHGPCPVHAHMVAPGRKPRGSAFRPHLPCKGPPSILVQQRKPFLRSG